MPTEFYRKPILTAVIPKVWSTESQMVYKCGKYMEELLWHLNDVLSVSTLVKKILLATVIHRRHKTALLIKAAWIQEIKPLTPSSLRALLDNVVTFTQIMHHISTFVDSLWLGMFMSSCIHTQRTHKSLESHKYCRLLIFVGENINWTIL